jgi:hypothetical protein
MRYEQRLRIQSCGDLYRHRLRFESLEDRRLLANVTVGNTNDVVNGTTSSIAELIATPGADGISLREAIQAANADTTADTIDFSVSGTIQLTTVGHTGEIAIDNNVTINGPGAGVLTLRAFAGTAAVGDGARIFNVDDGNLGTFKDISISGLTLTGGDVNGSGGAVRNASENLTVTDCKISANSAVSGGGFHNNGGHLSLRGCTINGNTILGSGAGIETLGGSLNVIESTISGNSTPSGGASGGIHSSASTTTIEFSTISGNSANYGGGISHSGVGILMTITGSTISGNTARNSGGGLSIVQGDVIVRHSTITRNRADSDNNGTGDGGGASILSAPTSVTLDHTIVAGNGRNSTTSDVFGLVVESSAFNIVGVSKGLTGISHGTNGNQIGTPGASIDPVLGALDNNGGATLTHRLLAGSPAIDAGSPALSPPPTQDQRGAPFVRVADGDGAGGAVIDIGAYERQTVTGINSVVDTLTDEIDGDYSSGELSLREAIGLANGSLGPDSITFAAALTSGGPATINLTSLGDLMITDSVAISGPGEDWLTIRAFDPDASGTNDGDGSRVFNINDEIMATMEVVEIAGVALTGGDANNDGGAISNREDLTIRQCTISGNYVHGSGGGVYSAFGNLAVVDCTISGNHADDDGGGIFSGAGNLSVIGSTISGNLALSGGGIFSNTNLTGSETTTIANSTISGNSNSGVFNLDGLTIIRYSTITANTAAPGVGGVASYADNYTRTEVHSSIIAGNVNSDVGFTGPFSNNSFQSNGYNLIGTGNATFEFVEPGDQTGIANPLLGSLDDNGGPTMTHALLAGSPTIDAGDPGFDPNAFTPSLTNDQRGAGFARVVGGRIDIGAFEVQPVGPALPGDYNEDDIVDAADYVVWRKTLGTTGVPAYSGADGDGDTAIDNDDYDVWSENFGEVVGGGAGGGGSSDAQLAVQVKAMMQEHGQLVSSYVTADNRAATRRVAFGRFAQSGEVSTSRQIVKAVSTGTFPTSVGPPSRINAELVKWIAFYDMADSITPQDDIIESCNLKREADVPSSHDFDLFFAEIGEDLIAEPRRGFSEPVMD